MDINRQNLDDLFRTISAAFRGALKTDAPQTYQMFATTVPSSSARNDYSWLGEAEELREWIGGRDLTQLASFDYSLKNRKFERTLACKADDIRDDVTGIYTTRAQMLADAANLWADKLCTEALTDNGLCYDGNNFFDTDHLSGGASFSNDNPNGSSDNRSDYIYCMDVSKPLKPVIMQLREGVSFDSLTDTSSDHVFKNDEFLYGARARGAAGYGFWQQAVRSKKGTTVSALRTELQSLRALGGGIKNDQGRKLGIRYNLILCSQTDEVLVRQAVESQYVDTSFTPNVIRNTFEVRVVPWL